MSLRAAQALAAIVLLAGLVGPAAAHTKSTSYSNVYRTVDRDRAAE